MAIMDAKLVIDDHAQITAISGATQAGTDEIRLDAATAQMKDAWGTAISPDIGEGNNGLVVNFAILSAFDYSCGMTCKVYSHTTSTVTGGALVGAVEFGSGSTIGTMGYEGSRAQVRLPAGNVDRYLGVLYSMITGPSGAGYIDAWVGLDTETPTT
jgi:hypothetical protein